jgi:hypothetical protein
MKKYDTKTIRKVIQLIDNMLNRWTKENDISDPHGEICDLMKKIENINKEQIDFALNTIDNLKQLINSELNRSHEEISFLREKVLLSF